MSLAYEYMTKNPPELDKAEKNARARARDCSLLALHPRCLAASDRASENQGETAMNDIGEVAPRFTSATHRS